jgi:hypothetical protein
MIDYVRVYQLQDTDGPFSVTVQPYKNGKVEISPVMDLYPENTEVLFTAIPDSGYQFKAWEYQSRANPFTLTVNKNTTVSPIFYNPNELLANSEFDKSFNPWTFYVENSSNTSYSASVEDSTFVLNITKSPATDWKFGFQELGLSLEKADYKLKFDAWAQNASQLLVTIAKNYSDWGSYVSKSASITTSRKSFEFTLNMPVADDNVRLYFGAGKFLGKVYFDNISLTKIVNGPSTGIADLKKNSDDFTVYPNPSNGKFRIKTAGEKFYKESKLEMFSFDGKPVFTQMLKVNDSEIDPGNLQPGFYFLKITSEGKSYSKSLVIQ